MYIGITSETSRPIPACIYYYYSTHRPLSSMHYWKQRICHQSVLCRRLADSKEGLFRPLLKNGRQRNGWANSLIPVVVEPYIAWTNALEDIVQKQKSKTGTNLMYKKYVPEKQFSDDFLEVDLYKYDWHHRNPMNPYQFSRKNLFSAHGLQDNRPLVFLL